MKRIKGLWWKMLGAFIFLYVLIGGMSVPLKPGVSLTSPSAVKSGETLALKIEGYNTNFKSSKELRAWLKLSDKEFIQSKNIRVASENEATLDFDIPNGLSDKKTVYPLTLIIDSDVDGSYVQPNAVFVSKGDTSVISKAQWVTNPLYDLHTLEEIRFPYRNILHETIRNTFFHVAIWMSMFVLLVVGLFYAIMYLKTSEYRYDILSSSFNVVAIVYGILGIATGSIWAKVTWGTYWTTDVKLNMAAVSMLIYLAYIILRGATQDFDRRAKLSAAYSIFAFLTMIPLLFIIPRMTDSLHPGNGGNPALGGEDLDNTLRMFFYPAIIAMTLLGTWLATLRIRVLNIEEKMLSKNK